MKKQATQLRREMWWRNKKMTLILILVGLLAIYIILGLICGFGFGKC
jgi:vesicle-associated membrane protein 7